jgi:hypothetical protein
LKSIDFKRKGSAIRVMNEDSKRIKYNWDRVVYIVFIIGALVFLSYYAVNKLFYIKADGQVLFENVSIRLTNDCRVLAYQKKEGDIVKKGDSLFTYTIDKDVLAGNFGPGGAIAVGGDTTYNNELENWREKEKYALLKKAGSNFIEIQQAKALIKTYQSEIERLQNEVVLDVLPKSRLEFVQNEILKLNNNIEVLNAENVQFYALIYQLDNTKLKPAVKTANGGVAANLFGNGAGGSAILGKQIFYSPIDGSVTRIYTQQFEVALKTEQIMAIHKNTPMYIKGFFEQSDMSYFKEGDMVNIEFPDGTKSTGLIRRFYYATYALPDEFQKRYEPTTRTIAADIYPVDPKEYTHWKSFYKLGATITKYKY